MDEKEALLIAREAFYTVMKYREDAPGLYELVASELDISDETMDEAFKCLFPEEE